MSETRNDVDAAGELFAKYESLKKEIGKVIIGQHEVVDALINAILANGHVLLVGVPGLAKTLLVRTLAEVLDLHFSRIQFTPDLMPGDITGSEVLNEKREFQFIRGPLFSNIVLADEINRTPPKTQAALLEAMQEKSVTVNGTMHQLSAPFFVLATQNPIEQEGTYPLPEAQLDRFMYNVVLTYPTYNEEIEVIRSTTGNEKATLSKIMTGNDILHYQQLVRKVPVTDHVMQYAVSLVSKTRPNTPLAAKTVNDYIEFGAGPRAGQYLILGAKAHALLKGSYSPDIDDVKAVAMDVLRHRLIKNYKAEAEGVSLEEIIKGLL
jgi:MoxR-like ATPase